LLIAVARWSSKIMAIKVGNAPCSWGILEFEGLTGKQMAYQQVLDELVETGYAGTELGNWGFMPTDPAILRMGLEKRCLTMLGAFVPVALKYPHAHIDGEIHALQIARLLAEATYDSAQKPFIVLADDNGADPTRTQNAGRITPEMGLRKAEWRIFARGAERIAGTVLAETGLPTVFHHHCAGYVETPDEIARLLDLVDPSLLGLVFDTGHYAYGSGTDDPQSVQDGFSRFADRIRYVHFKDCEPQIASRARIEGWDYFEAVRGGIFCELGRGYVDFPAVIASLRDNSYQGWIVVEQDVLPGMGTPRESALRNREYLKAIGI
jgi:inosose dehydratase